MIPRWLSECITALMEAAWWFAGWAILAELFARGHAPSPWALSAAALTAIALTNLLRRLDLEKSTMAGFGAVATLVFIYLLVQAQYGDFEFWNLGWLINLVDSPGDTVSGEAPLMLGSLSLFLFTLRWIVLIQNGLDPADVRGSFGIGIVVFTVALLVRDEIDGGNMVVRLVLPFVALGLVAMAATQQVQTGKVGGLRLVGPWGLTVLATVAAIFVIAGLAALAPVTGLSEPLLPLWRGILIAGAIFILILALPAILLAELLFILLPLEGLLGDGFPPPNEIGQLVEDENDDGGSGFGWLLLPLRVFAGILALLILLAGLVLLFLFLRRKPGEEEEREDLAPTGGVIQDLLSLLGSLRPQRRAAPRVPDLDEAALALRALYIDVLHAAARRGAERPASITPRQFVPALAELYGRHFCDQLTGAFEKTRYGRAKIELDEVRQLRQAWRAAAG
jgi:Domain of unknown function (DUF4129)